MRYLQLLSVFLLCAVWAVAQTDSSQTNPSPSTTSPSQSTTSAGQTSPSSGGETTVEGCLSGSSGNYTLTDKSGMSYQLTGDTAKLSEHVGHEIKVTGTTSSGSTAPSGSSSGTAEQSNSSQQSLQVSSVKHISKTCTSASH